MFILLLLLSIPFLAAVPVPFKNCGTPQDHVKISSMDATPFPPVPAKPLAFSGSATNDMTIVNGTVEVHVKFYGAELFHDTFVICDMDPAFKCPIAPGPITITRTESLPSQIPKGPYEMQVVGKEVVSKQPLFCVIVPFVIKDTPALDMELIEHVNAMHTSWKAGVNSKFAEATLDDAKVLCGVLEGGVRLPDWASGNNVAVPDTFDARDEWGDMCPSVKEVRDQGPCGSCWAFGAAHAMTDRMCIKSQGALKMDLSAGDPVSCCWWCGQGCNGGFPPMVWQYWERTGIVTGGFHEDGEGCLPYYWDRCEHHTTGKYPPCPESQQTPACKKQCKAGYPKTWDQDLHKSKSSYSVHADQEAIKKEIFENGPVEAAFTVYQDFLAYKSGVYRHVSGSQLGGHAISLYGWGVEDNTPYWLVKNSWNDDWGDHGFFKILRGKDECGIEANVVAGLPK